MKKEGNLPHPVDAEQQTLWEIEEYEETLILQMHSSNSFIPGHSHHQIKQSIGLQSLELQKNQTIAIKKPQH